MRSLLTVLLGAVLVLASPTGALAEEGTRGPLADPELAALKQAIGDFRTELAALRETCARLSGKDADDEGSKADCKARYAELRETYKQLKQQALDLAQRVRQWNVKAKDEEQRFAKEAEKEEAQKKEQASLSGKGLQEKLRWLENHMLQDRIDLELFEQRARDARAEAEKLEGAAREEALAVAGKWAAKAAAYAEELKRHEAERAALVAAIAKANKPKPVVKEAPKPVAQPLYSLEKLVYKLRALDEHLAQVRADLAWAGGNGYEEKVRKLEQLLVELDRERQQLVAQVPLAKEKLRAEIRASDEKIAYKRGEQAKNEALASALRAAAAQVTGEAREEFLAKAAKYDAAARDWAAAAAKYEAERQKLATLLWVVVR